MAKLETIATRPDRILIKTFRPVALPGFRISQTKFISVDDRLYCVIGQKTFHSPLYTHFVVIDSYGDLADDQMSAKVYEKISRLNIVQYFLKKEISFATKPANSSAITALEQKLSKHTNELLTDLLNEGEQVGTHFSALEKEATKLFSKPEWSFADFTNFDRRWQRFWGTYEKRLQKLFEFRELVIKHHLTDYLRNEQLQRLFVEANEMYQLFVDTIPLNGSLLLKVNHFIHLQYELGQTKTSHTRQYAAPKGDVNIYYFVRFGFIISLFLVLWTIVRLISGKGSLLAVIGVLIIAMFFFSVRIGNEVGMLRLVEKRLKDLRAKRLSSTTIIERHYKKPFQQLAKTKTEVIPTYTFVGTLVKFPRWLIGIGIGLLIIGILFYRIQETNPLVPIGYLFFGLVLVFTGIILPRFNIMKRTFILKDDELKIGKQTYTREDVIQVRLYDRANRVKIKLRTHPDPITYRINQADGQRINSHIKTWCDIHFVNYK